MQNQSIKSRDKTDLEKSSQMARPFAIETPDGPQSRRVQ